MKYFMTPFLRKGIYGFVIFAAAYLTTITVSATAQTSTPVPASPDVIEFSAKAGASITGTVTEADENWIVVNSGGRDIRIVLSDVGMNAESDDVFVKGMQIVAEGEMRGDDFGVPVMRATSIRAAQPSSVTIVP